MSDSLYFAQCRLPQSSGSKELRFTWDALRGFVSEDNSKFLIHPWIGNDTSKLFGAISKNEYIERVSYAIGAMQAGVFNKVVFSRTVVVDAPKRRGQALFAALLADYPNAFVYWIHHPDFGEWVGATPELLVSKTQDQFKVMSLAGTMPAHTQQEWSIELKKEQQIVTDEIVRSLHEHAAEEIHVEGPSTFMAGPVQHLCSQIHFQSADSASQWADRLSPTPAVCGHPREAALTWISAHESHNRGLYTGYLGVVYPTGDAQLFVNLRCMHWCDDQAILFVGGGLIPESDPSREWDETSWKADALRKHLER
ncbi:MAG: chorismate-binding protein [Flavobacteriales bacterium]